MFSRYDNIKVTTNDRGKKVYQSLTIPTIEDKEDDVYIITNSSDRLDILANKYYGNPRYWWVIAIANNIGKGTLMVEGGLQIRIPSNPATIIDQLKSSNQ